MKLDLATIDPKYLAARAAKQGGNILSPICRISYPHFFTAVSKSKKAKPEDKKVYSVSLLLPPSVDISLMKQAAKEAAVAEWGADKVANMKLKTPFLKADDWKYEGYLPGWTLIRPWTHTKPQVIVPINGINTRLVEEDEEEVYPGRWATASLNFYAYKGEQNGVGIGLNNIQLLDHDESLSSRTNAADEFDEVSGNFESTAKGNSIDDIF